MSVRHNIEPYTKRLRLTDRGAIWDMEVEPCVGGGPPTGRDTFRESHFGMLKLARSRYDERYSLGDRSDAASGYLQSTVATS